MPKIVSCYGLWLDDCANDNALMMAEIWEENKFLGFVPVKGNWRRPDKFETFIIS